MIISVISGGFDPLHSGHIEYIKSAKKCGERLIVALNSDDWLIKKKGKYFLPFFERQTILKSISYIDEVISFKDDEIGSCKNALIDLKAKYPNDHIIFCNGGDRNDANIPEQDVKGIEFKFSVGGDDKKNSSSWILNKWQYYFEERSWGSFFNLFQTKNIKVKELIVDPGKEISFQRHFSRSEIWLVSEGACYVKYANKANISSTNKLKLNKFDHYLVSLEQWHQIINPFKKPVHIIEIQYGDKCTENDIERIEKL